MDIQSRSIPRPLHFVGSLPSVGILMSVELCRESPGKFDSRTLSRETLSRWTGRRSIPRPISLRTAMAFSTAVCAALATLCRTMLCYAMLCYAMLCYAMLCYAVLYYIILYYTILYYTILYYTVLYCTTLYYTILHYIILYYIILYYTALYYVISSYSMTT